VLKKQQLVFGVAEKRPLVNWAALAKIYNQVNSIAVIPKK
jgi:hypothetical protein